MDDLMLYNEIGKNIKRRRQSLGITQEKLAELTNYSYSFIANIESRTFQSFSISALNNIAKALKTNMLNLLPKDTTTNITNEIKCLYCSYNTKIPYELIDIMKSIKGLTHKKIRLTCPICNHKIII